MVSTQVEKLNKITFNDSQNVTQPHVDAETDDLISTISLLLFFLITIVIIISIHINIRLLYIICRTFKQDYKSNYYPILMIMAFLNWPTAIVVILGFTVLMTTDKYSIKHSHSDGIHELSTKKILTFIVMLLFYTYPLCLSLLDFLLCTYRLFCVFGKSRLMTVWFRWFGPLLFILFFPIILGIVYFSKIYKTGFETFDEEDITYFISGYVLELSIKSVLAILSVAGYLSILLKVRKIKRQLGNMDTSEDIYIIRQALPIAIYQLFFTSIEIICEFTLGTSEWNNIVDLLDFSTSTIVVPISVIMGHPQRRRIFRNSRCCCRMERVQHSRNSHETYQI